MPTFNEVPSPSYDYEVSILVSYYEKALRDVRNELSRIDLTNYQRANVRATQNEIRKILKELDASALSWVDRYVPIAVQDGITRTLVALGVAVSVNEAKNFIKYNRLNRELVKTVVADTQDDLLQITQNVDRKVRNTVRQVTAEVMRSNLTKGINGTRTLTSDIVKDLRKQLDSAVDTGIIDASNRRWNPKVYAEMVVRTKMAESNRQATMNEAVGREAYYGVISRHGATDACRNYEGKIVKLAREANGNFPYIGDLPRREIFHVNCRHQVSPTRDPKLLPNNIKRNNDVE